MSTTRTKQDVYAVAFVTSYTPNEQKEPQIVAAVEKARVVLYDNTGMVHLGFARVDRRRQEKMRRAARVLLSYSDPFDEEVCLVDFLADLQHYCKTNGYDFDHAVETARMHFESEK